MSEESRMADFVSLLLLSLVKDGHFVAPKPGATYLYKQDMGAVSTICLHVLQDSSAEFIASHMTEFVEKNQYQQGIHVLHYYLYLTEDFSGRDQELLPLLQEWQKVCEEKRILLESVILDLAAASYQTVSGRKLPDKSLREVLEAALRNTANDAADQRRLTQQKEKEFLEWNRSLQPVNRKRRTLWNPVHLLIFVNVVVFFAGLVMSIQSGGGGDFHGDLFQQYGIQDNALIRQGEVWRLITSMFLHADLGHLFGNMLFLLYLGRILLRYYRDGQFWLIYFCSGLAGNLLSFFCTDYRSLGASGAIMGLGGVLIYRIFLGKNRKAFRRGGNYFMIAILVLYNLIYGLFAEGIDNYGHFGGFFAGFLMAWLFSWLDHRKQQQPSG